MGKHAAAIVVGTDGDSTSTEPAEAGERGTQVRVYFCHLRTSRVAERLEGKR